jgi:hypothetical protein
MGLMMLYVPSLSNKNSLQRRIAGHYGLHFKVTRQRVIWLQVEIQTLIGCALNRLMRGYTCRLNRLTGTQILGAKFKILAAEIEFVAYAVERLGA